MSLAEMIPWRGKREPDLSLADDFEIKSGLETELATSFPPLTPIQLEMQEIGIKRSGFEIAIEEGEILIAEYESEVARLKALNAERRSILSGLAQHEKVISFGQPKEAAPPEPRKGKKTVLQAAE